MAEALRINLKKRKEQRRAKVGQGDFIAPSDSEMPLSQNAEDPIMSRRSNI
ncbi:MAG: hypothetical protein ACKOQ2_20380 [Dolichospermum sp.]